ncbi:hypothetical protein KSP39_PZI014006 [Platanthera zijinensis]|uniref:Preprotein translocase subunit SCY2, chloroplastic n=1 Tax=Platanthera zijinensis TaxID=2320716 RepID=A0AAP0BC62_9ASPA
MDASTFISLSVRCPTFYHRPPPLRGGHGLLCRGFHPRRRQTSLFANPSSPHLFLRTHVRCFSRSPEKYINADSVGVEPPHTGTLIGSRGEVSSLLTPEEELTVSKPVRYRNRFLNFLRLGSVVDNMADSFFKSEIRRRLFATALLIVISRVGYFIPLPGFDRRLMPQDYLSFASGSTDELGDFSAELKLSLFQLGISPQIAASILMQVPDLDNVIHWDADVGVLCHILPSLVRLRKEGLDGHEKIKGYIWWGSLGFAMLEAVIVSCYSLQYSIYSASQRFKHVLITSFLLVVGAMTMTWISDTISESGFGHGSSLIICVGILTGYRETLFKLLSQFSGNIISFWPYLAAMFAIFTIVTMWAVLVTEGCRKIKLQYYGFKLASATRNGRSPVTEVEPYIPFNINPSGMQPVLTATYLLAFPSIIASIFRSPFAENLKEVLNPASSIGAEPWVFYAIYAFLVFLFNIFDIVNYPGELDGYVMKDGLRPPRPKPNRAELKYETGYLTSTRLDSGVVLSALRFPHSLLDQFLRKIHDIYSGGITSIPRIICSRVEKGSRRSVPAVSVCPISVSANAETTVYGHTIVQSRIHKPLY